MISVFFDIDGVLAQFVRGTFEVHQRSIPMREVDWDFHRKLGFEGEKEKDFWAPLGFDFWANLSVHDDGMALLRNVEGFFPKESIYLLSSPCDTFGCTEGKRAWVDKHLPDYKRRLFLGSAKKAFAGPTKLLVDDSSDNCKKFRDAGGHTVAPPRPWNSHACMMADGEGNFDPGMVTDWIRTTLAHMGHKFEG